MSIDLKDYCLESPMDQPAYKQIYRRYIQQNIMIFCNLHNEIQHDRVYCQ